MQYPRLKGGLKDRRNNIRVIADAFTIISITFVMLAVLVFLGAIILREPDASANFSPAAWLAALALWFHLVSQIIHIRANTEK
jgi:hypothetical protein